MNNYEDINKIETTNIENFDGIIRERVRRIIRKTKCHTKRKSKLIRSIELIQFYWNVMKPLHNKMTPAMFESLTTYKGDCNDFLKYRYAVQTRIFPKIL